MTLRIGSLCSGYEGLGMAVQAVLGGELAFVADPDPGATRILAHHHPDVPNLGDITTVDWDQVEPVDVLTAGFPCQDISNAGKRAGIEGARSGIWTNVAHALRVLRPRLVFLENVSAVLVRGLDRVLADLAAIGYDAAWACVRASDVGAPHRRERWFCVAWPTDTAGPRLEGAWLLGRVAERGGGLVADTDDVGGHGGGVARWEPQRHVAGACAAVADAPGVGRGEGWPESARLVGGSDVAVRGGADWGLYAGAIARWERAVGRAAPVPTELGRTGNPRLSPRFVEWLMGLPAGHVTDPAIGLSRTQQLHALGNGVVPQQGAHALRLLLERACALEAA